MSISGMDKETLHRYGFTESEIHKIASAVTSKGTEQNLNLNDPEWVNALQEHYKVKMAYYDTHPGCDESDYENFIDQWYENIVGSMDPWIWIDQNYYKSHYQLTKDQYRQAYVKVRTLTNQ